MGSFAEGPFNPSRVSSLLQENEVVVSRKRENGGRRSIVQHFPRGVMLTES